MVKPKQRNVSCVPGKKQQNQDEEDWMVVKKQKITILIPPLPGKVQSPVHSVDEGQLQETPQKTEKSRSPRKTSSNEQLPSQASASMQPDHELSRSISQSPMEPVYESLKSISQSSPKQATLLPFTPHPNSTPHKTLTLCNRAASDKSPLHSFREHKGIGKCSTGIGNRGIVLFADESKFMNQRMRATYLRKKLEKAGGLDKWLVSLGLTCFVDVFKRQNVNKFQLTNLTMEKLKGMGTNAVGPRRKLMHAIDCVCVPHCFQLM